METASWNITTSYVQTLNLLHGSHISPYLSTWTQVHISFDYNCTLLAPPGMCTLVHKTPNIHETWVPYAVDGLYLGPAMYHYTGATECG